MGPSQTVENYLKAILQAQIALGRRHALVPMGQLAAALRVVPTPGDAPMTRKAAHFTTIVSPMRATWSSNRLRPPSGFRANSRRRAQ